MERRTDQIAMGARGIAMGLCAALSLSGPGMADEWYSVVIGQSDPAAPRAFADAFHAAQAFRQGGVADVELVRDAPMEQALAALDAIPQRAGAMVYLAGPLSADGAGVTLGNGTLTFDAIVTRLHDSGITRAALLVENCTTQSMPMQMPAPPEGIQMMRAASTGPGAACATDDSRLTDALMRDVDTGMSLSDVLAPVWMSSNLTHPPMLDAPQPSGSPVVSPIISIVDTPAATTPEPVWTLSASQTAVVPVSATAPAGRSVGQVLIFEPTPQAQQAALPVDDTLPQPSIIVGLIDPTPASFSPAGDPGDVTGTEIAFDNLEARQTLRAQDPDLFAQLVAGGAFDPPQPVLASALQTELARMGCYTAGIDGIWGNGSRRSVERYFDEIDDAEAVGLDPSNALFRQIIARADVTCPVQAVVAAPRATPTRRATTPAAQPQRRATRPTQTQQQPSAPSTPRRTISNSNRLGLGVNR